MALVLEYKNGFDNIDPTRILYEFDALGAATPLVFTPGRSGISQSQSIGNLDGLQKNITSQDTILAQFWFKTPTTLAARKLWASVRTAVGNKVEIGYSAGGVISATRVLTPGTIATASNPAQNLSTSTEYYLEIALKTHQTTGTLSIRLNRVDLAGIAGLTALDTSGEATNTHNAFRLYSLGTDARLDDLHIYTGSGGVSLPGDWRGNLVIETIYPVADSADSGHNGWTGAGTPGSARYDRVNEPQAPNDDVNYNEASTVSAKQSYKFGALTGPSLASIGAISSVQLKVAARKTSAIPSKIKLLSVKVGSFGTDYLSPTNSLALTYGGARLIQEVRPDGSGVWTATDFGGSGNWEFGQFEED